MDYFFAQTITDICERSLLFAERPLRCMIIVNPAAGGYVIKSKWKNRVKTLQEYRKKAEANPKRPIYKNVILNLTQGKNSAGEITKSFIDRAVKDPVPFYLIISAGGDGTHGEVMLTLYNAPANIRSNIAVLRLPMGTGDDGADSASLAGALDLLLNPVHVEYTPAVQLTTAQNGSSSWKGPFLAFNVLSAGLDAFVVDMTNRLKGKFSGDSYKLWLNIATLFYDRKYKVDYFDVKAFDEQNREVLSFKEKLLLLAMGVSGHRTYGSQKKILPDERNVCAIKQMSLYRKIKIKNQVCKGTHAKSPESILFNAHRLEISGSHPILTQMDGETILMQPDDFPAILELTAPVIPLLKRN
jgi:diacylglycerol kinase family enzyme